MLQIFTSQGQKGDIPAPGSMTHLPDGAVWIDMNAPTPEEEKAVETLLGINLPSREELKDIEPSSRLYQRDDAVFLTATLVYHPFPGLTETADVAFILKAGLLITIRHADMKVFDLFIANLARDCAMCRTGPVTLVNLFEAIIDRTAENLERTSDAVDRMPTRIFPPGSGTRHRRSVGELESRLSEIASLQTLTAQVRESLVSLGRATGFLLSLEEFGDASELKAPMKSIARDIASLTDHASFVSSNIGFLLDASLGLINIEQNAIIKIFSIVAVVLLPPTLIASIYGMNFKFMPEIHWVLGYPMALVLMVLAAVLPYLWFKRMGWL